ncbi:MAG: 2-oxoglutarate dehydrogenase E1 component [Flavobacteriales bacterium]
MDKYSYLSNGDVTAIEELHKQFKSDPSSVDFGWQKFFEGFEFSKSDYSEGAAVPENVLKEFKILDLINGYRTRGHLFTKTNPVRERRTYEPTLALENFGLSEADLSTEFQAGDTIGLGKASLKAIVAHLEETYCQSIGVEYMYIREPEKIKWLRDRVELKNRTIFSVEDKKRFFNKLNQTTLFEQFLQKKFVGQKRFSVEGGESLIPALDAIIEKGAQKGVKDFVIGMAHRGRLNTLAHIMNKPYDQLFAEFEGREFEDESFDGDVKYHLGYSRDIKSDEGKDVCVTLCPNPSHLEAVDPIVEGLSRAIIDLDLKDENKIVPIQIHGDAAIAGQGVVYEVVQMAQLKGYRTGGTMHLVVNNQVGFTTNYLDARSSTYCTDVAKTTLCPVFHVNGDDIEAVVQTVLIALDYRNKWNSDVFIDLLGYRKYGHNEGDEPKFTQPKLYNAIAKHPDARRIYLDQLIAEGVMTEEDGELAKGALFEKLEAHFDKSKKIKNVKVEHFLEDTWKSYRFSERKDFEKSPTTAVSVKKLKELGTKMSTLPEGKNWFRKVKKLMQDRLNMLEADSLDWGSAEMLAYATLLEEGHPVRISGQDVERGTFSHRHAVVKDEETEEAYIGLNHVSKGQAPLTIYNSLLSEYGVLGFEYGYAFGSPNGLTIWEAQFGDFNNGAQIMIDQFITAAEDKWHAMNGLTMLLPHGYEGMGSEHSSGRMERYLQMCAGDNMVVCNATTPANYFHLLRRQCKWPFRKPLVVFTPKKLLRYPKAVSSLSEMAKGGFQEVLDDTGVKAANVKTVVFCSGKIYYDILEEKESRESGEDIAVIRLEQLYPYPDTQIKKILAKYMKAERVIWMQEEPENMGAWSFILRKWDDKNIELLSRKSSGSPAAGSSMVHANRQEKLMDSLFEYSTSNVLK